MNPADGDRGLIDASLHDVESALADALQDGRCLNAEGSRWRSRELALCLTRLEEARFWLRAAIMAGPK